MLAIIWWSKDSRRRCVFCGHVCVHELRCSSPKCSAVTGWSCCLMDWDWSRPAAGGPPAEPRHPRHLEKSWFSENQIFHFFNAKLEENHSKSTKFIKFAWLTQNRKSSNDLLSRCCTSTNNSGEIMGPASGGSGQTYLVLFVTEIEISQYSVIRLGLY